MHNLSVTFQTLTPLFLGGSVPREHAELRIPPIKSAIRYWYRAWLGRYLDLTQLQVHEARAFGSTDRQSSVLIKFDSYDGINPSKSSQQLPFVRRPAKRPSVNPGQSFTLRFLSPSTLDC